MISFDEGRLTFGFPNEWKVCKFDASSFYRNQFQSSCGGTKAVDIVALDGRQCLWLIEIKDYRKHPRTKPGGLPEEVAAKARDTLAALVTARIRANDDDERNVADASTRANSIRVVLHLELAPHRSKLFASKLDHANIQQRLRQLVKAIDPHSLTVDRSQPDRVPWNVRNSSDRRSTD
jgi:hypothetical protein